MHNKRKYVFVLVLMAATHYCAAQTLTQQLQQILDSIYAANPDAVGIIVDVESPDHHISWTSAAGRADKNDTAALKPLQPLLIASNTKTYVAAAILKLVEQGQLQLDQPIAGIIRPGTQIMLEQKKYALTQITIRQLLSHTSGIRDYVDDAYFEFVQKHPGYHWSRDEQIALSVSMGGQLSEAGKAFSYADINYLLLTEIIEGQSGKPFYIAMRELLGLDKLGLSNTWFVDLEQRPAAALPDAHQYWNKYKWDSYMINPSWDLYGGGGLMATMRDLALFFQAIFQGKIIKDQEVLANMYTFVLPGEVSNYCLGIRHLSFSGEKAYYHGGFWGTDVLYLPEQHMSIAVSTLEKSKRDLNAAVSDKIVRLLLAH